MLGKYFRQLQIVYVYLAFGVKPQTPTGTPTRTATYGPHWIASAPDTLCPCYATDIILKTCENVHLQCTPAPLFIFLNTLLRESTRKFS